MTDTKSKKVTLLDYDKVATILVEALLFGDKVAANRHGITQRTIQNYKARLRDDTELSELFARKKSIVEDDWVNEIKSAMIASIDFLKRASQEADPTNPEVIHAIAGAAKILSGIGLTKDLVDARIRSFNGTGQSGEETGFLDSGYTEN